MSKLRQTSSNCSGFIKLHVKMGECEFSAEGDNNLVSQQFEKFQKLICARPTTHSDSPTFQHTLPQHHSNSLPKEQEVALPSPEDLFEQDPYSSTLLCRTPPTGNEAEAKLVLLLLWGYQELRGIGEVTVLKIKQALKRSLHPVQRLDRVLNNYTRDRFLIKIGRGKGGKYRLTPIGTKKAMAIAAELRSEYGEG